MRALLIVAALTLLQTPPRSWRELLVVTGDEVSRDALESLTRRRTVTWMKASEATREDLARGNVTLVGTTASNHFLRELAPAEFNAWYERPGYVVQIVQRNPLNPDYRMTLVIGTIDGPLPRQRADVHIRRDGKTVLLGFEGDEGGFTTRQFELATTPRLEEGGFRFFVHGVDVSDAELRRLIVPGERADVHVYRSLEEKGLITDDTRSAHVEGGVFHVVLGVDDLPARLISETLSADDQPTVPLLVRRGRAAVSVYDERTLDRLDETARRLLRTSEPPSLAALLDDDERFESLSPFVSEAISASFMRFVGERELDEAGLESAWSSALAKREPAPASAEPLRASFQRGVTYAHMGYQIHNGYLSSRSDESLSRLESMGIDAVALVPYAFVDDPRAVVPFEIPTRAGSETDEDVVHAISRARDRGMTVLLKPQIWVRRGWPGDLEPVGAEETERFFREYRHWILHYALMAEAHGVPLLAVGTEMAKLSRGYREHWRTILADIRCVYSGKLVYAANWGSEVLGVDFWDLLDYIGVDFYYPLSVDERASDDELRRGFETALDELRKLHERHEKPVLLTEIGYASTKSPWTKPHASDKADEVSGADQARAYEVAFTALEDETDWIRGMYWWKWPTDLGRGGDEHRGFTPNGKPAEGVLRRWYGARLQ